MLGGLSTRQNAIIIGMRLKTKREEKGISKEEVAKLLDLSSCLIIESWEDGETSPPDISYLNSLAKFYGVDVDYFIKGVKKYESDA